MPYVKQVELTYLCFKGWFRALADTEDAKATNPNSFGDLEKCILVR